MRKLIWLGAIALLAGAGAGRAEAQGLVPIAIEGRLDAGIPIGDSRDALETGVGWGVTGFLYLTPTLGLYAGYSHFEFGIEGLDGADVSASGADLGARVTLGTGGGVWTPFVQVGALLHEDETGFEAGLGAFYPVGQNLSVTPMVRYRSLDGLDYVTLGIGLNVRL